MKRIFDVIVGLRKPTPEEIHEEYDARMRQEYFDPIERFPERIDQLLDVINRVGVFSLLSHSSRMFSFLVVHNVKSGTERNCNLIFLL